MRLWTVVVGAALLPFAACDRTQPNTEKTTASEQKPAAAAAPAQPPAKPCEQRFTPIGMALTRAAMDKKTGQQCRTANNAPPAFQSLPMCLDLFRKDMPTDAAAPVAPTPAKLCEQRFTPIGMALTRAAVDTKTGQLCRTAENAPPAFRSAPLCSDLLKRFPD